METLYLLISILLIILIYIYYLVTKNVWKNQNIPYLPNKLPIIGHVLPALLFKKSMSMICDDIYNKCSSDRSSMCGFYFMNKPSVLISDPILVKSIFVNNFSSFQDNGFILDSKLDPVLIKNPFFCSGETWKEARIKIISHFTGKKFKYLFDIVNNVCTKMENYVSRKITAEKMKNYTEFELKDLFSKYTGEIVANAAFGIEGQSFDDNPNPKSFTEVAKTLFDPTPFEGFCQLIRFYLPNLANILGIGFISKKVDQYFRETLHAIIKERKQKNHQANDYLQFVIDQYKETMDMENIMAEIISFYVDVYETSSLTLSYLFYNLANNKNIQDKLRSEIKTFLKENNNVVTYENIKNMSYLEKVIHESMRIKPAFGFYMKVCTEEITLEGCDGLSCTMKPGNMAFISATSLHKDERYWSNPEIFAPERFESGNREINKDKATFLPFGEGPRVCVGQRLAFMLMKLLVIRLISNFIVEPSPKTRDIEIDATSAVALLLYPKNGIWLRFKPV